MLAMREHFLVGSVSRIVAILHGYDPGYVLGTTQLVEVYIRHTDEPDLPFTL